MIPVTQGSQSKRHPRRSSSGYFGCGQERSCPSTTRRKYSQPFRIEEFVPGIPISANKISAQTVALHLGQYTSSPSPQNLQGGGSLKTSAPDPKMPYPSKPNLPSDRVSNFSTRSLRAK